MNNLTTDQQRRVFLSQLESELTTAAPALRRLRRMLEASAEVVREHPHWLTTEAREHFHELALETYDAERVCLQLHAGLMPAGEVK